LNLKFILYIYAQREIEGGRERERERERDRERDRDRERERERIHLIFQIINKHVLSSFL